MLTLKQTINNSPKLQKVLEESKRKRDKKLKKNKAYCEKSKESRNRALSEEYPLKKMKKQRKRFPILLFLVRLRLAISGVKIISLNKFDGKNVKAPVIFVPTHMGKFDIEVVYSCIKKHALLLSGTEDRMHGSADGWFLENNGVNYVDRSDKADRANVVKKMQKDLENGFNLLWYIEGTWNLSANRLVYPLSYSVIKLALQCNVPIVPIGLNQLGKDIYIKFGSPFYPDVNKELTDAILDLRDVLATLKWDIYEYVKQTRADGYITRASLDENYWSDYLIDRVKEWYMTDLFEELEYVFKPKGEAHAFFEEFNNSLYMK